MKAKAIFHNDSCDCQIEFTNNRGGKTWVLFSTVSSMVNYANEHGIDIIDIETI